jgi:phosphopantothenoylcysteine decarboxylase/phosphopantothenate--cysteine ligase
VVAANVDLPAPPGVHVVPVTDARSLQQATVELSAGADAIVMTAAVADFRPARSSDHKIKKQDDGAVPVVELVRNPDVLVELVAAKPRPEQLVVGFAAETGDDEGDVLTHGRAKLARKGCDLLVVNEVGDGKAFGTDSNAVVVLGADGSQVVVPQAAKAEVAAAVWDLVSHRLERRPG